MLLQAACHSVRGMRIPAIGCQYEQNVIEALPILNTLNKQIVVGAFNRSNVKNNVRGVVI